jgi:hypothetical protein
MQGPATLSSIFRSLNAIFAVVVAIVVTGRFGDSSTGKIVTVVITSGVVALFEVVLRWAPKRSSYVRQLLDERSMFAGAWLQEVVLAHGAGAAADRAQKNSFGIFFVTYVGKYENYAVDGTAYTRTGREHARWASTEVVNFARDGFVMTYEWTGEITNPLRTDTNLQRSGFASVSIPDKNAGKGRVDHVGADVSLEVNITRITKAWLTECGLGEYEPANLSSPLGRDRFALAFAPVHVKAAHGQDRRRRPAARSATSSPSA